MLKTISSNFYLTSSQKRLFLINPRWYIGIFSRGTGKTTFKQAIRSLLTAQNVPHGLSVFYNATYVGAQQRTVANIIPGWKKMGLVEGVDFVYNIKPPKSFIQNKFYQPFEYKNTISYRNGHTFILASNDRPGLVNSLSITGGIFVDELRFLKYETMVQDLYPAIRGTNIWGTNNPYTFSRTYTTDMPFITDEADWIFDFEKLMIPEQILLIAQISIKCEKIKNKILLQKNLFQNTSNYTKQIIILEEINRLKQKLQYKENLLNLVRTHFVTEKNGKTEIHKKSVYFDTGSFFANLNILGPEYFFENSESSKNVSYKKRITK